MEQAADNRFYGKFNLSLGKPNDKKNIDSLSSSRFLKGVDYVKDACDITGVKYKRGQYDEAIFDLQKIVDVATGEKDD